MAAAASRADTVVDCSWTLSEHSAHWPTVCPLRRTVLLEPSSTRPPRARSKQAFELNGGDGTHIDAPSHFVPGGATVDQLDPESLVCPLVIIDVSEACANNADYAVPTSALLDDEARHGAIPARAFVCIRTGWGARYASPERYANITDAADISQAYGLPRMHFPGLSSAAATWLLSERHVCGVGIDTLSPDPGAAEEGFAVHHAVLGAGKYIVENLNLESVEPLEARAADGERHLGARSAAGGARIPVRGATAVIAPAKLAGAPEAPCRVLALVPAAPAPA